VHTTNAHKSSVFVISIYFLLFYFSSNTPTSSVCLSFGALDTLLRWIGVVL
jgi:hypothetical protein